MNPKNISGRICLYSVTLVLVYISLFLLISCSKRSNQDYYNSNTIPENEKQPTDKETEAGDEESDAGTEAVGIDTEPKMDSESQTETYSETIMNTDTRTEKETETNTLSQDECIHPAVETSCENGWCRIPAGCYIYGAPPTEPCWGPQIEKQTEVVLTHDFEIAQTEITQTQWKSLGFLNPYETDPPCPDCPVGYINWFDALAYCNALSEREGLEKCYDLSCCEGVVGAGCPNEYQACSDATYKCDCNIHRYANYYECPGYRLPTSAEWQYSARGGTTTATYNGDLPSDIENCATESVLDHIAWHCGNTDKAMPVAQKEPNAWGLYDMLGNIYEWLSDNYDGYSIGHGVERVIDPQGIPKSSTATKNGGCFWRNSCYVRASAMILDSKSLRMFINGFRPARTLTFPQTGTDQNTETESLFDSESGSTTDTATDNTEDAGTDTQCLGRTDFSFCSLDTTSTYGVDYANDICIDETCVSVGMCNDAPCNVPGRHFASPPVTGSARLTRTEPVAGQAIVTDSVTGLVWQGDLPELYDECTLGHPDPDGTQCAWWQAFAYCDGLDLGGYTDWYLPDEHELMSIIDYGAFNPALDAGLFPDAPVDIFWTSSSYDSEYAWLLSMDIGRFEYWYKDFGAFVRCVRREPGGIPDRFARTEPIIGEPVVSDQVTGLLWQGCAAGQAGDAIDCAGVEMLYPGGDSPESAATYCEVLDWGGLSDWRLPDIKELASLSDTRQQADAAIDESAFPSTPAIWFWSSTPYAPYPDHAWFVDFDTGHANIADETYGHAVRCVR